MTIRGLMTTLGVGTYVLLTRSVAGRRTPMDAMDGQRWWIDRVAIEYRLRHDILADHPPRLRLTHLVSLLSPVYLIVAAAVLGVVALAVRRVAWSAAFLTVLAVGPVVRFVLKPLAGRRVPTAGGGTGLAFPSGHLAILGAFLMAVFLLTRDAATIWRIAVAIPLVCVAAGFAVLHTVTGNHFATDCLGGLLAGACLVAIGGSIASTLESNAPIWTRVDAR